MLLAGLVPLCDYLYQYVTTVTSKRLIIVSESETALLCSLGCGLGSPARPNLDPRDT